MGSSLGYPYKAVNVFSSEDDACTTKPHHERLSQILPDLDVSLQKAEISSADSAQIVKF